MSIFKIQEGQASPSPIRRPCSWCASSWLKKEIYL